MAYLGLRKSTTTAREASTTHPGQLGGLTTILESPQTRCRTPVRLLASYSAGRVRRRPDIADSQSMSEMQTEAEPVEALPEVVNQASSHEEPCPIPGEFGVAYTLFTRTPKSSAIRGKIADGLFGPKSGNRFFIKKSTYTTNGKDQRPVLQCKEAPFSHGKYVAQDSSADELAKCLQNAFDTVSKERGGAQQACTFDGQMQVAELLKVRVTNPDVLAALCKEFVKEVPGLKIELYVYTGAERKTVKWIESNESSLAHTAAARRPKRKRAAASSSETQGAQGTAEPSSVMNQETVPPGTTLAVRSQGIAADVTATTQLNAAELALTETQRLRFKQEKDHLREMNGLNFTALIVEAARKEVAAGTVTLSNVAKKCKEAQAAATQLGFGPQSDSSPAPNVPAPAPDAPAPSANDRALSPSASAPPPSPPAPSPSVPVPAAVQAQDS